MAHARILIAGIGNIFLGDDGFGCEVAARLARRELPDGVRVIDFGVRGLGLAYALMDDYDAVVMVDAAPRGAAPGAVYVIEPDLRELSEAKAQEMNSQAFVDAHTMNPLKAIALAGSMGGKIKRLLLVGCEPLTLGPEEGQMGLSEPVAAAVDEAVSAVESLVAGLLEGRRAAAA